MSTKHLLSRSKFIRMAAAKIQVWMPAGAGGDLIVGVEAGDRRLRQRFLGLASFRANCFSVTLTLAMGLSWNHHFSGSLNRHRTYQPGLVPLHLRAEDRAGVGTELRLKLTPDIAANQWLGHSLSSTGESLIDLGG